MSDTTNFEAAKYSSRDTRGALFVDCSECRRGGKGDEKVKCSAGWQIKKGNKGGCFSGHLLNHLVVDRLDKEG